MGACACALNFSKTVANHRNRLAYGLYVSHINPIFPLIRPFHYSPRQCKPDLVCFYKYVESFLFPPGYLFL